MKLSFARLLFTVVFAAGCMMMLIAAADCDGDGYSAPDDCNDQDASINPAAVEQGDWIDSNCNGYEDAPMGFRKESSVLDGGMAMSVEWYQDYVYVSAGALLQVYHAPAGSVPEKVHEIEIRDIGREMARANGVLFVANRGDGLLAFDLTNPAAPQLRGRVSGLFDAPGQPLPVEAVFGGVDAKWDGYKHVVAVARINNGFKIEGGVDVAVFEYDAQCDPLGECFTITHAFDARDIRSADLEMPVTVGLTDDAEGLFIGYFGPEIAYVDLNAPSNVLNMTFGFVYDIQVVGDTAYVASGQNSDDSILSRLRVVNGQLERDLIHSFYGKGPGEALDIHGDMLCFGGGGPNRDPDGYNLFVYSGVAQGGIPTLVAGGGTLDWIFQLACRDTGNGTGWVYEADEWGGLQFWERNGSELITPHEDNGIWEDDGDYPPNHMRMKTGMFSHGMWMDREGELPTVYSLKEGAGIWAFEMDSSGAIQNERSAIEYINVRDPGCNEQCVCSPSMEPDCECCPPEFGERPYPPAIFTGNGASSQGRLLVIGHDRNEAVGLHPYFLMFREDDQGDHFEYEAIYGEAIPRQMTFFGLRTGVDGWVLKSEPADGYAIVLASLEVDDLFDDVLNLRIYQHCLGENPDGPDDMRLLGEVEVVDRGDGFMLSDAVLYDEYLFVTDVFGAPSTTYGQIHAYKWRDAPLTSCEQPALQISPIHLGTFGEAFNPNKLLMDKDNDRLLVGTSRTIAPNQNTAVLVYEDLAGCFVNTDACFEGEEPGIIDRRTQINVQDQIVHQGVNRPDVRAMVVDGDLLHYVDYFNGLYTYSFATQTYTRFYPAHRPDFNDALLPELIRVPNGDFPIYNPLALEMIETQNGKKFIVQEHTLGRVSILVEENEP